MKIAVQLLALCFLMCAVTYAETATPRVCRPVGEPKPASFQAALDRPVPTHLRLMGIRYVRLQQTVEGFASTGRIMVSRDDDGILTPAECGDDPGLFLAAPALMRVTGSSLSSAIDTILLACLFIPLFYAVVLFRFDRQFSHNRKWMLAGLLLVLGIGFAVGDLYLIAASMAAAAVAAASTATAPLRGAELNLIVFGALAGTANAFRAHSGTAAVLFVLVSIAIASLSLRKKLQLAGAILTGLLVIAVSLHVTLRQRDLYLQDSNGGTVVVNGHPFWHTIYVSLGYVNNPQVPALSDASGVDRVRTVDPKVPCYSNAYERILRAAVVEVVVRHPFIILANIFAKTGTIVLIAGMFLIPLRRWTPQPLKSWRNLPWWVATGFSAAAGVLAYPAPRYLSGMLAFLVMFQAARLAEASSRTIRAKGASA